MNNASRVTHRWRPVWAIRLTFLLHGAALLILLIQPAWWREVLALLLTNHMLLSVAVLFPRSQFLGVNLTRLPLSATQRKEVALTFDDGPDPHTTPQILDLLERYQARASFFCIGEKAAAFPEIIREIIQRGHSVENHSYHHPHAFAFYGIARLRREVQAMQKTISDIAGQSPRFFRAPAGFRSPLLDYVLAHEGLHYASWTRRGFDGVQCNPDQVLQRLADGLAAGDILMLHDGASTAQSPAVLVVLPALLQQLTAAGLTSVTLPHAIYG
ncbi:MAG: polysaccharide deacetylase family protein [Gallionellaceae bacterium]|nr:polysaccharide deacetylase family protein [Gallionellaceae bacterium]